jgi:hypothetical protein
MVLFLFWLEIVLDMHHQVLYVFRLYECVCISYLDAVDVRLASQRMDN